jgi:hypothetical protein
LAARVLKNAAGVNLQWCANLSRPLDLDPHAVALQRLAGEVDVRNASALHPVAVHLPLKAARDSLEKRDDAGRNVPLKRTWHV